MSLCSFTESAPTEIYTLSLHDALPISTARLFIAEGARVAITGRDRKLLDVAKTEFGDQALAVQSRSEEHTSELQSLRHLVCRLLLEKKNKNNNKQCQQSLTSTPQLN